MKRRVLAFAYTVYRLLWRITRPITLGVRLMMVKEGKILLVKHSYQPHWYMPGGAVKQGELAQDAAAREAREEVGAELHAPPVLFGAYTGFSQYKSDHVLLYFSEDFTIGTATDSWEIEEWQWFDLTALPESVSPATSRRIAEYQRGGGPFSGHW